MKPRLIDFLPPGAERPAEFNPPVPEHDRIPTVRLFMNPFYDKVFMLDLQMRIRTNQTKNKTSLAGYKNLTEQMISKVGLDERFPHSGDMLLILHFTGSREQMAQLDVDNMAKRLIDQMKGIVMVDDNRVCKLWIDKSIDQTTGCKVGIKFLDSTEAVSLIPPLLFREDDYRQLLSVNGVSLDDLLRDAQIQEP